MQTDTDGAAVHVKLTGDDLDVLTVIRRMPYRHYDAGRDVWVVDNVLENYDVAHQSGLNCIFPSMPASRATGVSVNPGTSKLLRLVVPPTAENSQFARFIPDNKSFSKTTNAWLVKPTRRNVEYIQMQWPDVPWSEGALELVKTTEAPFVHDRSELASLVEAATRDFKFKTSPYEHQLNAFALGRDMKVQALFMDMGTGKTYVIILQGSYLFSVGKVEGMLIVCPKSMKSTWQDEVATHMPDYIDREVLVWKSGKTDAEDVGRLLQRPADVMKVFVINIDALNTDRGYGACELFLSKINALMGVDESSRIKNQGAARTKACIKLGKLAKFRRILTGMPVTQGPLDLFSQMKFLDEHILGFGSYYAFRNHFAIMGGWQNKQVLKYVNMTELQDLVGPYSFRVTKDECLDLPDKVYKKIIVELTPQQRDLYDKLVADMEAEIAGVGTISATIALTLLLRLHQVTGGFIPSSMEQKLSGVTYVPIPGPNPKIEAMMDYLEDVDKKTIVWAHFRAEIDLITRALREKYGEQSVVEFHGGCNDQAREDALNRFQGKKDGTGEFVGDDPGCRFFVGQTETGGLGLTLTKAKEVIYNSNSFSLESRLQSEDRPHRIGQHDHVNYTDIVAKKTIDEKLLKVLRKKVELSNLITGDDWREWI